MPLDENRVRSFDFETVPVRVRPTDAILYALGLGIGADPLDPRALRYVYEEGLSVFPTMPLTLGSPGLWFEAAGLDFRKLVHGAQALELHKAVPFEVDLQAQSKVVGLWDRGAEKGAVVDVERQLTQADGALIARLVSTYALRGDGGFGGIAPARDVWAKPDRTPAAEAILPILPQAALLYRLNGDMNPLHADPVRAKSVGFDRPILHGLCSFAMVARGVIDQLCPDEPEALRAISARFSRPVFPGETLRVRIWHDHNEVLFEASVDERDIVVLSGGRARIA
nr:MaoC/PaaZ C-terminal domain-containing protein [Amylibacter sp.]